jgi:hypothetical protein
MLSKLETEFVSDRNHFFSKIVKFHRKRSTSSRSLTSIREDGGPVINDTDEMKRLLFDLHSRMGKQDADLDDFDKPHYFEITSLVSSISGTELGPDFCEKDITLDKIDAALADAQSHRLMVWIRLLTNLSDSVQSDCPRLCTLFLMCFSKQVFAQASGQRPWFT